MMNSPSRIGALALLLLAGIGLGYFVLGGRSQPHLVNSANAQTVDNPPSTSETTAASSLQDPPAAGNPALPSANEQKLATEMVQADRGGRHLAPRGTFYLLSYVSVKTDKGVDGFPPGTEVKFVEANREKQSLVVTNGRAEVEVPASKLTNDLDVAAMVRNNDQTNQAKVTAYAQAEQEAYNKFQRQAAEATAKDLDEKRKEQAEQVQAVQQAQAAQRDTPAAEVSSSYGAGYYNSGGYGYGSPYSYFTGGGAAAPQVPATAPGNAASRASAPNRVAVPRGGGGGGPVGPATAPSGNTGSGAPAANAGTSTSGSTSGGGKPK